MLLLVLLLVLVVMILLLMLLYHVSDMLLVRANIGIRPSHDGCSGEPLSKLGSELKLLEVRWTSCMLLWGGRIRRRHIVGTILDLRGLGFLRLSRGIYMLVHFFR